MKKSILVCALLSFALNSYSQTFSSTEQLSSEIKQNLAESIRVIETDQTSDNMPHADFDRKRKELLDKTNLALETFERNIQKKIIDRLEYFSRS